MFPLPLGALKPQVWAAIGAGLIILALVAGLLATRSTLYKTRLERDNYATKLSVSNGSIRRLEESLKKVTEQQAALANSDANRFNASRQAIQIADAAAAVRSASIQRLRQSAEVIRGEAPGEQCAVSAAVDRVWPI